MATPPRAPVTYEELADLEADFDDFDVELLRSQATQERTLYARRAHLVRRIPGFWPLVLEQAPPEIDQYVQPLDSHVLLSALEDVEVHRFEVADGAPDGGDPRSIALRFTFAPNDVFADRVLEKRFWHRTAPSRHHKKAWSGLVSEPVPIRWKEGKDLTAGLLDLAVRVWASPDHGPDHAALRAALDTTALGAVSFFAWFGYVGRRITADESRAAVVAERAARAARQAERADKDDNAENKDDDNYTDDDTDDDEYPLEIFPDGDTLAVTLAEDLWPNAIKYFRQAQELDAPSDEDFVSGSEDDEAPPLTKKQKQ